MYSKGLAYLLWALSGFGALGLHRFYLGKPLSGLLWMVTGGLAGLGSLYDLFTLGTQVDAANFRRAALGMGAGGRGTGRGGGWRYVDDGEARPHKEENLDAVILRIARANGGTVNPSEVVIEANITVEEARQRLERMAAHGQAEMRIRKSGAIVFVFPEFMNDDSPFEDI
jgi:TM2 domain-containing membrane protein YozV